MREESRQAGAKAAECDEHAPSESHDKTAEPIALPAELDWDTVVRGAEIVERWELYADSLVTELVIDLFRLFLSQSQK
jgi:hypothetical protein